MFYSSNNINTKIMENSREETFFQSEEYRRKYLKEMKEKEQKTPEMEIKDISGNKVDVIKLFQEIDGEIENKTLFKDMLANIVSKYNIEKNDAIMAISHVNVVRHQWKDEGKKWGVIDKEE